MRSGPRAAGAPLLAVVAELYARVEARDAAWVDALCEREAARLPREVREEAMAVARTGARGHRAPLRLLLFWRAARALDREVRDAHERRDQLELDLVARTPAWNEACDPRAVMRHLPTTQAR